MAMSTKKRKFDRENHSYLTAAFQSMKRAKQTRQVQPIWIGSPMTTVSFDHGTFDHGRLTAGQ